MKNNTKRFLFLLPWAVSAGFILSLALLGQQQFKMLSSSNCYNPNYLDLSQVKNVSCGSLEEGYPLKFLKSESGVSTNHDPSNGDIILSSASVPKIDAYKLVTDVLIWSGVSLVALWFLSLGLKQPKQQPRRKR